MRTADMFNPLTEREDPSSPASSLHKITPDSQAVTAYTPDTLLTVNQMARWLNISLATAYRLTESAQIPSFRIRRAIRIRKGDVDSYLAKQRVSWDRE